MRRRRANGRKAEPRPGKAHPKGVRLRSVRLVTGPELVLSGIVACVLWVGSWRRRR